MQVLHEEMHPITDPIVRARHPHALRDTRHGTSGYALHVDLELTNIAATEALVAALTPRLAPSFQRWRSQLRTPTDATTSR